MTRLVRKNAGGGHTYWVDGVKYDGVTTLLGKGYPMQLKQWAANMSADYALEHWAELSQMSLLKRGDAIRYAHNDALKRAGLRGTKIHSYGELLVAGEEVDVPDEHRGPAEAYARFLDTWDIQPIAVETPLVNLQYQYAGTADLWATIGRRDNVRALIDLKTAASVWPKDALQLAAYRHAELWQPDEDIEEPLPPVDEVFVAHILPDTVRLLPIVAGPAEFRQFLYVQATARWLYRVDTWPDPPPEEDRVIGDAIHPEQVTA